MYQGALGSQELWRDPGGSWKEQEQQPAGVVGQEAEGNRTDCRVSVSAPPDPESLLGSPIPSVLQAGRGQQHLPSFTHTSQLLDGVL